MNIKWLSKHQDEILLKLLVASGLREDRRPTATIKELKTQMSAIRSLKNKALILTLNVEGSVIVTLTQEGVNAAYKSRGYYYKFYDIRRLGREAKRLEIS